MRIMDGDGVDHGSPLYAVSIATSGTLPFSLRLPRQSSPASKPGPSKLERTKDTMTVAKRKAYVLDNLSIFRPRLKVILSRLHARLPSPLPRGCWLDPSPPTGGVSHRTPSCLKTTIYFRTASGPHSLCINTGVVALLMAQSLTPEQAMGFIHYGWHLSHLCGNWACCNPAHLTLEPGHINLKRNSCFRRSWMPCQHKPLCLKQLKRKSLPGVRTAEKEIGEERLSKVRRGGVAAPSNMATMDWSTEVMASTDEFDAAAWLSQVLGDDVLSLIDGSIFRTKIPLPSGTPTCAFEHSDTE